MNKRVPVIFIVMLIAPTSTLADVQDCREAVDQITSARSELHDALVRYARCIADSDGHDDCSLEFSRLRSEHDEFESAVARYESDCN